MGQKHGDAGRGGARSGGRRRALRVMAGLAGAAVLAQAVAPRTEAAFVPGTPDTVTGSLLVQGTVTADADVQFAGSIKNSSGVTLIDQSGCYYAD